MDRNLKDIKEELNNLLRDDTNPDKPKKMMVGNKPTKKFLDWNLKMIREGKTNNYILGNKIYNQSTDRLINLPLDHRKNITTPTRAGILRAKQQGLIGSKITANKLNNPVRKDEISKLIDRMEKAKEQTLNTGRGKFIVNLNNLPLKIALKYIDRDRLKGPFAMAAKSVDADNWITLTHERIPKLKQYEDLRGDDYSERMGSDVEFINELIKSPLLEVEIYDISLKRTERKKNQGGFFKYYHTTDYDFSRYDIYNKKQNNYNDNCLYIALKNAGCEQHKLNTLKTYIKNTVVPKSALNKICEELDICIKLNMIYGNTKTLYYGDKTKNMFHIGLYEQHYFLIEKTNVTSYALSHYEEVKDLPRNNEIIGKFIQNGKIQYQRSKRFCNSLNLFKILTDEDNKLIEEVPLNDLLDTQYWSNKIENDNLEYDITKNTDENTISKNNNEDAYRVFFDCETDTSQQNHTVYEINAVFDNDEEIKVQIYGRECAKTFLKKLAENVTKHNRDKLLMIAHNLKYDITFILNQIYGLNMVMNGSRVITANGYIYNENGDKINIIFQDSYNFIATKLSRFPEMFGLKSEKEIMPYSIYNKGNICRKYITLAECFKDKIFKDEEIKNGFIENCNKWDCFKNFGNVKKVNILKYSGKYCSLDCIILRDGYNKFRNWMMEITGLDIVNYYTLPSIGLDYLIKKGCFEGCYKISGVPRDFMQKCVIGGRVMTANNKMVKCYNDAADFDAVNLYGSAMNRMEGFLKGLPKIIKTRDVYNKEENDNLIKYLKSVDGFFIKVRCLNNPVKNYSFPLLSNKNDEGIRNFSNNTKDNIYYIDKTLFEDCTNFQGLEFHIINGYYYNDGRNNKINKVIRKLFNERKQKKAEGNPIQEIYKLLMNSCYGKCLLKPIDTETKIINKNKWDVYLRRNYNFIIEYSELDNYIIAKIKKPINKHFNNCYAGIEILTMSKRIMNEVMTTAEDNEIKIYYTDTDSMHIENDKIELLAKIFKEKYNRELIGNDMGQFHTDFEMQGYNNIISKKSIYLGKKCYIDYLEGYKYSDNGEIIDIKNDYHIRMKGISANSIKYYAEHNNITPFEIYEKLYNLEKIEFDIMCGGEAVIFRYNKALKIHSLKAGEFYRKIKFYKKVNGVKIRRCDI